MAKKWQANAVNERKATVRAKNLNASMATQVEVKLCGVGDANVNCGSCRYVATLTLLDTHTMRLNGRQYMNCSNNTVQQTDSLLKYSTHIFRCYSRLCSIKFSSRISHSDSVNQEQKYSQGH